MEIALRQDRQRQLGAHALGAQQDPEAVALVGVGEAVEGQGVLAHHELGAHEALLARKYGV